MSAIPEAIKLVGDFDGDGKTDIALTGVDWWNTLPVAFSKGRIGFGIKNKYVGTFAFLAAGAGVARLAKDFN